MFRPEFDPLPWHSRIIRYVSNAHGEIILEYIEDSVCTAVANCLCTHESVILVYIPRVAKQKNGVYTRYNQNIHNNKKHSESANLRRA